MGKPADPEYWKKYRASHPAYIARERVLGRVRKAKRGPRDRRAEYIKRAQKRGTTVFTPLPELFPHLRHGNVLSFWEDELRMDLEQERALALLEGRDPNEAVRAYRGRETNWQKHTGEISDETFHQPSALWGVED